MAAGDLRKRQKERQDARDERRASAPSGITSADAGGSRIPNAEDRVTGERVEATANRWARAIDAGHRPEDYGYDPVTRRKVDKPVLSPAEATKSRMEMYASQQRSRTGAPAPAAPTTSAAATDANVPVLGGVLDAAKDYAKPGPSTRPAAAPATPSARFPGGKIDGKPAWQVLQEARIRTEGEDSTPSAAERRNKDEFLAWEASRQDPADMAGATTPGAPSAEVTKKPDAVATPIEPYGPPRSLMNKPGTSPGSAPTDADKEASPGPTEEAKAGAGKSLYDQWALPVSAVNKSPLGFALAADLSNRRVDKITGAATKAWNAATDMTNTTNRALRRVGSLEHGLAKITKDIIPRATTLTTNAAQEAARLKGATTGARVMAGKMGVETTYDAARAAAEQSKKADRLAHFTKRAGQHGVATADKLKTARTVATELTEDAAKLTAKSDKLVAAANAAKGTGALKAVGKVAGKVAVPVEVAANLIEAGRLVGSEKHREARAKEFEQYADKGTLSSVGQSALNPVAGIYSFGRQVGKLADSSADAKAASTEADRAQAAFDRRQEMLRSRGYSKESLAKLSQKERSAILRDIRQRA